MMQNYHISSANTQEITQLCTKLDIDGLAQDCDISSANILKLPQSSAESSNYYT